jgi:hypothetical protein
MPLCVCINGLKLNDGNVLTLVERPRLLEELHPARSLDPTWHSAKNRLPTRQQLHPTAREMKRRPFPLFSLSAPEAAPVQHFLQP